jgi:hypothetical protein
MKFVVCILLLYSAVAFYVPLSRVISSDRLAVLDAGAITKLEEMKSTYDRLSNVVSPEAEAEMKSMQELVEKYTTLKEIKTMLGKLRTMWRSEASERRRSKQLSSFMQLYKGRIEIETLIAQKLDVSVDESKVASLDEVIKLDAEISELEAALKKEEITLPEGMSTREARFGALP